MSLLRNLQGRIPNHRPIERLTSGSPNAFAPRDRSRYNPIVVAETPIYADYEDPIPDNLPHSSAVLEEMPEIPSVKDLLDAQDRLPERNRVGGNAEGYMHMSSLIATCARKEILAAQHAGMEVFNNVTGGHRLVWAYGRAAEKHVRGQFIAATGGNLYGRWKCVCGHTEALGWGTDIHHLTCNRCTGPVEHYHEEPIYDHERKIVGNSDMPFTVGNDWLVIGECKSMNKVDWDKLTAPLNDHVLQAATYRRLYQNAGWKVHDKVVVLYAVKEFKFGSPYKEFHVDVSSGMMETQVDDILAMAEEIAAARATRSIPPRTICGSSQNPIAKQCPMASLCFNLPG